MEKHSEESAYLLMSIIVFLFMFIFVVSVNSGSGSIGSSVLKGASTVIAALPIALNGIAAGIAYHAGRVFGYIFP